MSLNKDAEAWLRGLKEEIEEDEKSLKKGYEIIFGDADDYFGIDEDGYLAFYLDGKKEHVYTYI